MKYNTKEEDTYTIIELDGEVDLSCSPEARKQILDCLTQKKNLLIDLDNVSYIDTGNPRDAQETVARDITWGCQRQKLTRQLVQAAQLL